MAVATTIDLSQPMANILRQGTAEAHERAEHSQGAKWLARGELDKEEYVRFLMMLWHIYDAFERALEQHATHPVLAPTHNPGLFSRSASIAADISYLLDVPEASWQTHPLHAALMASPPPALTQYVSRIQELAAGPDPSRLLAHAYVRYLGDLSGGQFIRRRIVKAYGLDDGAGVSFYEFRPLGGSSSGATTTTMGELKKIKEWYRDGMNAGVGDNAELKAAILDEAQLAFDYNTALFDALNPPSTASSSSSDVEIDSPLHSPVESSPPTPPSTDLSHAPLLGAVKEQPKVLYEASQPPTEERLVSISSVIALVAALSLTHFVLVIGGFTGEKGYAKLEAFQQWLNGLVGA
ncbi:heme oxygenase-like protein [Pilatotrama ljubarskyi]|nr:heme oxygenase-like protein [Pilatotrama ljubarskyi]